MAENQEKITSIIEMAANSRNERMRQLALSVTALHQEAKDNLLKASGKAILTGCFLTASIGWALGGIVAVFRGADIKVGIVMVALGLVGGIFTDRVFRSGIGNISDYHRARLDAASITTALATHIIAER